jgi:hypothetical protein
VTKSDLATKLRQQLEASLAGDRESLRPLTMAGIGPEGILEWAGTAGDDAVIDAYLECPDCGSRIAEGAELESIIAESQCEQDFFARCQAAADSRLCRFYWPAGIVAREVI